MGKRCLAAIVLLLFVIAAVLVLFWPRSLEERYASIRIGMSSAEAEQLMGGPTHIWACSGRVLDDGVFESWEMKEGHYRCLQWNSPRLTVVAVFNQQDALVCRYRGEGQPWPWLARLRERFGY